MGAIAAGDVPDDYIDQLSKMYLSTVTFSHSKYFLNSFPATPNFHTDVGPCIKHKFLNKNLFILNLSSVWCELILIDTCNVSTFKHSRKVQTKDTYYLLEF